MSAISELVQKHVDNEIAIRELRLAQEQIDYDLLDKLAQSNMVKYLKIDWAALRRDF